MLLVLPAVMAVHVPSFELQNAAVHGMRYPAIGLGTGAYSDVYVTSGEYPECWSVKAGCGSGAKFFYVT